MANLTDNIINPEYLDLATRSSALGPKGAGTFSLINGLNFNTGLPIVPPNIDEQGIVFFTRPCLNLSYHNVLNIRELAFLTDRNTESMASAIRCMLNPIGYDYARPDTVYTEGPFGDDYRSTINDDKNAFIPMLGNTLLTLSGWRDQVNDIWTSKETFSKSQVAWTESNMFDYSTYDITATFTNIEGDPLSVLFKVWRMYQAGVSEGSMVPFPINLGMNRVDYNTRFYKLTLDRTGQYVQNIIAPGAAFPYTLPIGAKHNYDRTKRFSEDNNQISITFKCMGVMYDDPALISDFNTVVCKANLNMCDSERENEMVKLSVDEVKTFDCRRYPRISPAMELEWWVELATYNSLIDIYNTSPLVDPDELSQNGVTQ